MYNRDAIIAVTDLRYLADDLLGQHSGGERNPTWPCPNPQHAQTGRTPPVSIFTSNRGEERWRCHGCGEGGSAIDLVIACRGCDVREALEDLAGRAGVRENDRELRPQARPAVSVPPVPVGDPEGLADYVDECASRLWKPEGSEVRSWLTETRGIPAHVLRRNRVGADLGPARQDRPNGMPRSKGAVLPVIEGDKVAYAQLRVLHPQPDRPRYLNPSSKVAANPRIGRFRPPDIAHPEVIVTEGALDALSAASAGYRSVAVLSAAYPDRRLALELSRLLHPLVVAFDADSAGREGGDRLQALLTAEHRPPARINLVEGDLNDALRASKDWSFEFPERVDHAFGSMMAKELAGRER